MQLTRFRHKGLRQLHAEGNGKGVRLLWRTSCANFVALETSKTLDEIGRFSGWRLHPLKGNLKDFWSLTVTGNWRLIFRYDEETNTASEIDLIDYH